MSVKKLDLAVFAKDPKHFELLEASFAGETRGTEYEIPLSPHGYQNRFPEPVAYANLVFWETELLKRFLRLRVSTQDYFLERLAEEFGELLKENAGRSEKLMIVIVVRWAKLKRKRIVTHYYLGDGNIDFELNDD